jgi:phthiocerol/phenolphthiocerol synthesis type-I polyketide synthase E
MTTIPEPSVSSGAAPDDLDIAVVGMAGRFPGALNLEQYWRNIRDGVCSVTWFDDAALDAAGADPRARQDPNFVPAGFVLEGLDRFDAAFFGYSPREAELIDPQHRLLLETAWEALEDAGHDPRQRSELVGVYAGCGASSYLMFNVAAHPEIVKDLGGNQVMLGNRPDFLASRISYKIGLEGPSIDVQSACSSSLVAIVLACQALLSFQCDVALAGGVSVDSTRSQGYVFQLDGLFSPDGVCRTFDARAQGTVGGNGVGMVTLKRVTDAVAAGDRIRAVIKGSAVNNDGAARAGFTAPSVDGQALVITTALANAGIDPDAIGYVEAHGTATVLGDPIEVAGLNAAFVGVPTGRCALGSVKPNIGHLDAAAGVAGLIKTVLCLEQGVIPPLPNYESPNPRIDFAVSPFYIPTQAASWPDSDEPRRAGVSSFGLGGTNAHVVLEQAPPAIALADDRPQTQLLVLSARTDAALDAATERLADALRSSHLPAPADLAHTLQTGRCEFLVRRAVVCRSLIDARDVLDDRTNPRMLTATTSGPRPLAFLLTGFGENYPGMGRDLYAQEPAFREAMDECALCYANAVAATGEPDDLLAVLFDATVSEDAANATGEGNDSTLRGGSSLRDLFAVPPASDHPLADPRVGHPALFALEYALAQLWRSRGVMPDVMVGHSLGEYVAACLAGVFSLRDAMLLVQRRGALLSKQVGGAMLAVPLSEPEVARFLNADVCLAAVNGLRTCVLSGPEAEIAQVAKALFADGVASRQVATRHAFHSAMTDPVVEPFYDLVAQIQLSPPRVPFVSNTTGDWITDAQATDPAYWSSHLRETVRFADAVERLWRNAPPVLLELGPGQTLTSLALQHPAVRSAHDAAAATSLPGSLRGTSEREHLLDAHARLWLAGVKLDWTGVVGAPAQIVAAPTYPFERRSYWLNSRLDSTSGQPRLNVRVGDPSCWFSVPTWRRATPPGAQLDLALNATQNPQVRSPQRWLVLADDGGLADLLVARLTERGEEVVMVLARPSGALSGKLESASAGASSSSDEQRLKTLVVDPSDSHAWHQLALRLDQGGLPQRLVHCWMLDLADPDRRPTNPHAAADAVIARGFGSLVRWLQAAEPALVIDSPRWDVVTRGALSVVGTESVDPAAAAVLGLVRVVPQEYPGLRVVLHDLPPGTCMSEAQAEAEADELLAALLRPEPPAVSAVRGAHRWLPGHESIQLVPAAARVLVTGDTYLITGGLGKIALALAHGIAQRVCVRFVLVGRHGVPGPAQARAIAALEALGSEVLVYEADVADSAAVREVVELVTARFGPIHGVLHAAGSTGPAAHRVLAELDDVQLDLHVRPKVHGMLALDQALAGQPLKFALLFSSLAAVLGGLGFASYAAANAVLDAAADRTAGPWLQWTSIDWEAWRFDTDADAGGLPGIGAAVEQFTLTPAQGMTVLDHVLGMPPGGRIVVSTGDLAERTRRWADPSVTAKSSAATRHARPNLRNAYVAPRNELERRIGGVWVQLLGIEEIGVHDSFFELGGNSLLGLQVVQRLRRDLHIPVPLTIIYEGPTVASLARLLTSANDAQRPAGTSAVLSPRVAGSDDKAVTDRTDL